MRKLSKSDQDARISQNEARRRKEVALARQREIEVGRLEGELFEAVAVKSAVVEMHAAIREAVLRIPDKCAPRVAATADPRECRAILLHECRAILGNLSDELRTR